MCSCQKKTYNQHSGYAWIRFRTDLSFWIRIRIRIGNTYPDPDTTTQILFPNIESVFVPTLEGTYVLEHKIGYK